MAFAVVRHGSNPVGDPTNGLFMAGTILNTYHLDLGRIQKKIMFWGSTKDGRGAASLNRLAAEAMIDVITQNLLEGSWSFQSWSDRYRNAFKKDAVGASQNYWILEGNMLKNLVALKVGSAYAVGIKKGAVGMKSPNTNYLKGKPTPVRDYVYYGIHGSGGANGRTQPPRNFYARAFLTVVKQEAPEMHKEALRIVEAAITDMAKKLSKRAASYGHDVVMARFEAITEQHLEKSYPGYNDLSEHRRIYIRNETIKSVTGDDSGFQVSENIAGMARKSSKLKKGIDEDILLLEELEKRYKRFHPRIYAKFGRWHFSRWKGNVKRKKGWKITYGGKK